MWKLVVLAFGEDEFAVIRVDRNDGKDRAFVVNTQASVLGLADNLNVESLVNEGGTVGFTLKGASGSSRFRGKLASQGPSAGQVLGKFHLRNEIFPARFERTRIARVADRRPSPLIRSFTASRGSESGGQGERPAAGSPEVQRNTDELPVLRGNPGGRPRPRRCRPTGSGRWSMR